MSDQPSKEQMMKMFVPALAVALVILLVGVLVAYRNNDDTSGGDGGKPIPGAANKTSTPSGDTDGLTLDKPPEDSPEWQARPDGLKIWDVKVGDGLPAAEGAEVTIHYTGWTLGGTIFDSSVQKGGGPMTWPLGRLIEGWQKGIPGMKAGGIRRLYIPWAMAYGADGDGRKIPPKADLIFEIKLFAAK